MTALNNRRVLLLRWAVELDGSYPIPCACAYVQNKKHCGEQGNDFGDRLLTGSVQNMLWGYLGALATTLWHG
jgi:hypothetical protein